MKKKITALMVSLSMIFLTGCQGTGAVDVTTLQIKGNGELSITLVESFDKSYYDIAELESSIEAAVSKYNSENGNDCVSLNEVKQKESNAVVKMEYASAKDYQSFNQIPFYVGDVDNAYLAGYQFDGLTSISGDGSTIGMVETQDAGYTVIAVQEKINIKVPGKVLYTSDTVSAVSAKEVSITDDETISYIIYE